MTAEPNVNNMVLVLTDQQRYDTLGVTGCPCAHTPHIDHLARNGMVFHNHFTTSPVCMPSRATMFTGRYINEHGVWNNGCRLNPEADTLPRVLGRHGIQTAHFGKLHLEPVLNRVSVPDPYGFETAEVSEGDQQNTCDAHWRWLRANYPDPCYRYQTQLFEEGHTKGYRSVLTEEQHLTTYTTDRAVEWLRDGRDGQRPFFLSVGLFDPHHAFNPCEPFYSQFEDAEMPPPVFEEGAADQRPAHYASMLQWAQRFTRDPATMLSIQRAYHAMIAHIDVSVGRLLDELNAQGVADDTLVVFSSDHGELLGDHGLLFKGPYLLDSLLRVPLVMGPAGDQKLGVQTTGLTSAVDVFATLCELMGVTPPPNSGRAFLSRDLRLFPHGERRHVLSEWEDDQREETRRLRSVRTRRHRLTVYEEDETGEFYDYEEDPNECWNRFSSPAHREARQALEELLAGYYQAERPAVPRECEW